jgi:hypothetical protein
MFGAEPLATNDLDDGTRCIMEQFKEPMFPMFNDDEEELEMESSHRRKRMKKDEQGAEINDHIQADKRKSNAVVENKSFVPPLEDTIVDSNTIQIAACMSQQIYGANTEEDFKLKTDTGKDGKVVLLEKKVDSIRQFLQFQWLLSIIRS